MFDPRRISVLACACVLRASSTLAAAAEKRVTVSWKLEDV
jgi:hypothetical protein